MPDVATDELDRTLAVTEFLDHDSAPVREFVESVFGTADLDPREKAVRLYYAVRDTLFYEVYGVDINRDGLRASAIAAGGRGFCLHKSILYAAAVRAVGVPSKLVFGDVRNHLASERLRKLVGGEVFFHVLTSVQLDGRWIRATPVFNKTLCKLYGMAPLEFDGATDSMHHPFDGSDGTRMEFLRMHGEFDDLPFDFVRSRLVAQHPDFVAGSTTAPGGSLAAEAVSPATSSGGHHD